MFSITPTAIDVPAVLAAVEDPSCGAALLFVGVVRDTNQGRRVLYLEYEAYVEMAEKALADIETRLRAEFGEVRCAIVHRVGRLEIGEASVVIAVAAPHRDVAYRASRAAIEMLKRDVPIWKHEHFEGGAVWLEGPGVSSASHDGATAPPPRSPSTGSG